MSRSMLLKVVDVLTRPTQEELNTLAFELRNNALSLARHVSRLATRPVTVAEFLLGGVDHGIDFSHYDVLIARADKVLRADAAAFYIEHNIEFSIAGCVEALRGALEMAEPYRKIARPAGAAK